MPSPPPSPQQPSDTATNGVFRDGKWLCNCPTRLPAKMRTIKSSYSKNHGKRFWGCRAGQQENHCDMFVLEEEAQRRERENLKSNGRSEKKQTVLPQTYTPRKVKQKLPSRSPVKGEVIDLEAVDDVASASNSRPPPQSSKLSPSTRAVESDQYDSSSGEDEDDYIFNDRAKSPIRNTILRPSAMAKTPATGSRTKQPSQEENYLEELSESGTEDLAALAETSAKAAIRHGKQRESPITPSTTRMTNIENGLPTPSLTRGKSPKKMLFNDSEGSESSTCDGASAKRQRLNESEAVRLFGTTATVPPARVSLSPSPAPSVSSQPVATNLTSDVMGLLKNENISPSARSAVRLTLEKYVNQAKGFERGRDASRKAVKNAEDRIARLQARIDDLEQARKNSKAELMNIHQRM
ncbi:hypothetical protein F5B22DRAFT_591839 [Xylaria bambusicola]|uniref:uncharacterized protein n=1 Tax=Xylaria bambusicola TaxID=326684 RepID=UPI00200814A8|nr:uncharacterized protein F5B22DRAFT_591839 [Xylaria bambusicola]KAI0523751.1 hypothetical protein F5B22DRAFT_591839 [Xylaria bambusicola]